jgi:hypothetical protein
MRHNKQGGSERVKRISRGVAALELFRISNRDPLQPRQRALLKSPAQLYYYSPPPLPPSPSPRTRLSSPPVSSGRAGLRPRARQLRSVSRCFPLPRPPPGAFRITRCAASWLAARYRSFPSPSSGFSRVTSCVTSSWRCVGDTFRV